MTQNYKTGTYCFPELKGPPSGDGLFSSHHAVQKNTLKEQLAALQAQGYEQGRSVGCADTLAVEQARLQPLGELSAQVGQLVESHETLIRTQTPRMVLEMAFVLAGDIIAAGLNEKPELCEHIIGNALQTVSGQEQIKIKAHPEDHPCIQRLLNQSGGMAGGMAGGMIDLADKTTIASDPVIQKGGCIIETEFGIIDARIDQQVAALSAGLSAALAECRLDDCYPADLDRIFRHLQQALQTMTPIKAYGHVTKVVGLVVEANGPPVQLGSICDIYGMEKAAPIAAEVLGFRDRTVLMMPLEEIRTIGPGCRVVARHQRATAVVGRQLLGRVIDGLGNPIDSGGPITSTAAYPLYANPINPLLRKRIQSPLDMGVRAINGLLTVGCGQRMGIFAGSGVGKSILMGMIARKSKADVNVIALIGERGRELNDFIEKDLGVEGLKKSVVIVATSDHLPLVRVRGAFVAAAIADYFRDQGLTVNFMMDSLTRFAMAQREIGLALGEPPTTKGYTPSVFTQLPKLLERAGTSDHSGSITGLYTVLVEGDDMNDPIADAARSILDGHVVLSRDLAAQNHYPAIDVLRSISRVMDDIASLKHKHNAGRLKELLAAYSKAEDLINIGAYVSGSNPGIDRAIAKIDRINAYLRQGIQESIDLEQSIEQLDAILNAED